MSTQAANFAKNWLAAASKCLNAVSVQLVQDGASNVDGAASTCITQMRKFYDSRGLGKSLDEIFRAKVTAACEPGQPGVTHNLNDILGPGSTLSQHLNVSNLGSYCQFFGGSGSMTSVSDWLDCTEAANEKAVAASVYSGFPNAEVWLVDVASAFSNVIPPSSDPSQVSDARNGLINLHQEILDELNNP